MLSWLDRGRYYAQQAACAAVLVPMMRLWHLGLGAGRDALREQAAAIAGELSAIEGALVDVKRESPRDVLRNPAGLDDTLIDLISVASTADAAPTTQAHAVSAEIIGKVREQIAALDRVVDGAIATLNTALAEAGIEYIGTGKAKA